MSQTNTKQCQDTRRGEQSHGGSHGTCHGDIYGNCGNRPFANSLFVEKLAKNYILHLSIIKSGPQSNQLKKILDALPDLCQDKYYDYIPDIISTNTKLTQEYFLSYHRIKRLRSSKHHVKLGNVNPIIGLDVPSSTSPVNSKMVENTPIFNPNLQEQSRLNYNQKSKMKFQKWNELIADKKFAMHIILN